MRITRLQIENFKSLKLVEIFPGDLTALVGANASGKSNFAQAIEFIGEVYRSGLELAVMNKGGFENIAYRRLRRTKSAIVFDITFEIDRSELRSLFNPIFFRMLKLNFNGTYKIRHTFSLKALRQSIIADYFVESETIDCSRLENGNSTTLFTLTNANNKIAFKTPKHEDFKEISEYIKIFNTNTPGKTNQLAFSWFFRPTRSKLAGIISYQFSPQICRSPGIPTNTPRITGYGENLPAVVNWIRTAHPELWDWIISQMKIIYPGLEDISVTYLHTRSLGLLFKEASFGRAWTSEEISDGTIQTLAMLCALGDPHRGLIFIDEPENSLHPWITRNLIKYIIDQSKNNQIILSTHSPIILNLLTPADVWICFREEGATKLTHLSDSAPALFEDWESGKFRLFELLDLGIVREAVPGGQK